jgi:hypothetical protein
MKGLKVFITFSFIAVLFPHVILADEPESGESLFKARCGICHQLPDPTILKPGQWPRLLDTKQKLISAEECETVIYQQQSSACNPVARHICFIIHRTCRLFASVSLQSNTAKYSSLQSNKEYFAAFYLPAKKNVPRNYRYMPDGIIFAVCNVCCGGQTCTERRTCNVSE